MYFRFSKCMMDLDMLYSARHLKSGWNLKVFLFEKDGLLIGYTLTCICPLLHGWFCNMPFLKLAMKVVMLS